MTLPTHMIGAFAAAAVITANLLPGQGYGTPEELIAKRDAKLESEFLDKANWLTDYDQALIEAEEQNKLIFAYFTRSYEDSPGSTAIEEGALSDPAFVDFGERVVLFLHVTSFVVGERHGRLLTEKGGRTFPTFMFLNEKGEVLAMQPGGEYTVSEFRVTLDALTEWMELRSRAEGGDRGVANQLFLAELRLGKVDFERAKDRATRLKGFTEEQLGEIAARMRNLEFDSILSEPGPPDSIAARLVEMKDDGRIPTGAKAPQFWMRIMTFAASDLRRDADLFEEGLDAIRKLWGDDERYARAIEAMERTLEELRG